jgi:hypothetical protein
MPKGATPPGGMARKLFAINYLSYFNLVKSSL